LSPRTTVKLGLGALLRIDRQAPGGVRPHVILDADSGPVALEVDQLIGQEEAVLKPLASPLDLVPGLAGVTILGSGRPIFILDVPRLQV
jgi:two-component system chemotaxis sensor kinase CheA